MDQRTLRSGTPLAKKLLAPNAGGAGPAPAPQNKTVAAAPMFEGTVHLAGLTFKQTDNGVVTALSNADLAMAIKYMTLAARSISRYVDQYGVHAVNVGQVPLIGEVQIQTNTYNPGSLADWINTLAAQNHLPSSDCICVLNPPGLFNQGLTLNDGIGGYHYKANCPYIFVNLTGTGFTLDDSAFDYAIALSHELAEMIVDPDASSNPEVCDPCAYNCGHLSLNYFTADGRYVGSVTDGAPAFAFDYFISGIAQPRFVQNCPAPSSACGYWPEIWQRIGTTGYREIVATSHDDGRLALFALGADAAVWRNEQLVVGGAWGGWVSLGGAKLTAIAVATNADGRLEVFAIGAGGVVSHVWQVPVSLNWGQWEVLGGNNLTQLAPILDATGRINLFVLDKTGAVARFSQDGPNGNWGASAPPGGHAIVQIQVGSNTDKTMELLAIGGDGFVYRSRQAAPLDGFGAWNKLDNSPVLSQVALIGDSTGRLQLFAVGKDGVARHVSQVAASGNWGAWESLAGQALRSVSAALNADGRMEVFAIGSDGLVYHKWQGAGGAAWGNWASLGGTQDITFVEVWTMLTAARTIVAFGLTTDGVPVAISQTAPNGGWS